MKVNWWDSYVGLPFKRDGRDRTGIDCYGLIYLIYKEQLEIDLNPFSGIFVDQSPETMLKVAKLMNEDRENWDRPNNIREFDMLQLRTGRHAFHVGIAINEHQMMHVEEGIDVVIENILSPLWRNRIEWIYRHKYMKEFRRFSA